MKQLRSLTAALLAATCVQTASASNPLLEPSQLPIPRLHETPHLVRNKQVIDPTVDTIKIAQALRTQFQTALLPLSDPKPNCESESAANYAKALRVAGRYDECAQLALECADANSRYTTVILTTGGLCEATRYNFEKADILFEKATNANHQSSDFFEESVYQHAAYALYGIHENQVNAILARSTRWTQDEQKYWKAVIQRVAKIDTGDLTKAQVDQFIESHIQKTTGSFQALLKINKIEIFLNDYNYANAVNSLAKKAASLNDPLLWYYQGYQLLYYGLDTQFAKARAIYDAFDDFSNIWMRFPVENNTYNYTEIYGSICKNQLLQGNDLETFNGFKAKLRAGELSVEKALVEAQKLVQQFPNKADVLTTYAGLQAMIGQHQQAFETYWQAHRACRYYHRANWGLTLEKRFFKYSHMPDYEINAQRVEQELQGKPIPTEISRYILNWNSLDTNSQRRVQFGARIWLPYMKPLLESNSVAYIKYAFDLLSESPRLGMLKDQRIGGSEYPNDNRLWDDVRGIGGESVVADLAEVFQTVQGDYNLLGHEVAHQFHAYLENSYQPGAKCIVELYAKAKNENNFPDGYSAYNKEEHFAQGVTYAMIPSSAPARFGLNRTWLEKNNKQQLSFIESIESSNGDLNAIKCSL